MQKKSTNRILWDKQVKRLKNAMRAVKKEGFKISFEIPEAPKRVTKQTINKLKNITRNTLRQSADYFVEPETGEYLTAQEKIEQTKIEKQDIRKRKSLFKKFKDVREQFLNLEVGDDEYTEAYNNYANTLPEDEKQAISGLPHADFNFRQQKEQSAEKKYNDTINEDVYTDIGNDFISFLNSFSSIATGAEYVKNAILNITKDVSIIGQAYSATVSHYGDFTFNEAYNISLATTWLEEFIRHMPSDMQNYYDENKDLFDSALEDLDTGDEYDY